MAGSTAASAASAISSHRADGHAGHAGTDRTHGGGGHRQRGDPEPDQHAGEQRVRRCFSADADRLARLAPGLGGDRHQLQDGRLPRVGEVGQVGGHPVGGHRVLRQVVGADRQELDLVEDLVREQRGTRHLDHHAGLEPARADGLAELARLGDGRHHRGHHPALGAGAFGSDRDRVELAMEQPRIGERQPESPHPEGRVLLVGMGRERDRLVGAGIEGADDDVLPLGRERLEHPRVDVGLLVDTRLGLPVEEAQLGAEQADPGDRLGTRCDRRGRVGDVGEQLDRAVVRGASRTRPRRQLGALGPVLGDARGRLVLLGVGLDACRTGRRRERCDRRASRSRRWRRPRRGCRAAAR